MGYTPDGTFTGADDTRYQAARPMLEAYELANGLRDSEGRRVTRDPETLVWFVSNHYGGRESSRWINKADAVAKLASLQPLDFEAVGRQAALNDEPAAPSVNAQVRYALAGRPVGDPENIRIMEAFSKGYQAVRNEQAAEEDRVAPATDGDGNPCWNVWVTGDQLSPHTFHAHADAVTFANRKSDEGMKVYTDFAASQDEMFTVVGETVVEEVPVVTPVLVWGDGTVTAGVMELADRLTGQAYGHDVGEFTLYVTQGGGLERATTRRLSTSTDEDDWMHEQVGVFAGDADEPVITVGLRIDGRA
jgi:hypothetical protein